MIKRRYLILAPRILAPSIIALAASYWCSTAYAVTFKPPRNAAPRQTTGASSRGNIFAPATGNTPGNSVTQLSSNERSRVENQPFSRGAAATRPDKLVGLVPQDFYGITISERPTVMVYLPASNAKEAVFSIKDEAGNTHHQMTIAVTGKPGVIAITLPKDAPALAVGKGYQWFLALKLNGKLGPNSPYIDSWIERIQPSEELVMAMQQRDALRRAKALGENGVWYDCVATLANLYASQLDNPTIFKYWQELLSSVSLRQIAMAPLVASVNSLTDLR